MALASIWCGDRHWKDGQFILRVMRVIKPDLVIQGSAKGADLLSEAAAKRLQINYNGFPAKWRRYGKPAGPIRNNEQLSYLIWFATDMGMEMLVVAFHDNFNESKGTKDMVNIAKAADIPVLLFAHNDGSDDGRDFTYDQMHSS